MVDLPTNWADNTGMIEDAAFLNLLGGKVNTLTHAAPAAGAYSSRPSAGNAGALYFSQDNDTLYRDNGSSWDKIRIGADSCSAMGDVPTSGWTAVNMQSGASWSADKDAMLFTIPSIGSGDNWQYQYRTYPTPPFTLTTYLDPTFTNGALGSGAAMFGIVISDGTKLIHLGGFWAATTGTGRIATGWNFGALQWTNVTTFSSAYNTDAVPQNYIGAMPRWWRLVDDNTNRSLQYSVNGIEWSTVVTESRTTFLTPTRIGVGGENYTGNPLLMRVRSWNGVS